MADLPMSSTKNESVLRKIEKPLIGKKRKTKINQDQLEIALEENVEKNELHVVRLDKAEMLEKTVKDLHPTQQKDSSVFPTPSDDTLLNESSENSSLKEQSSGHGSAVRRLSFSSSAENTSATSDTVWRPW